MVCILGTATALVATGCEGCDDDVCVAGEPGCMGNPPVTTTSGVPECLAVEFLPPADPSVVIAGGNRTWSCSGGGAAEDCQGNSSYQAFTYEDWAITVQLFFDRSVVGNYSQESFRQAYQRAVLTLVYPGAARSTTDASVADIKFEHRARSSFEDLVESGALRYGDGKLTLELSYEVDQVSFETTSSDPDCRIDDMVGVCYCDYDVEMTVPILIDLPVEA